MKIGWGRKKGEHQISYFNWPLYIGMFLVLGIVTTLPTLLFGGMDVLLSETTLRLGKWYLLYWCGATVIFSLLMAYQKYISFDKPMNQFREAARRVASGDFSVYLAPVHRTGKKDYVDAMFEDFNRMVEELGSIETLKSNFIADVSHEIKTPLATIQNYITLLQEEGLSEDKKTEYLEIIFHASKRVTELVTNILRLNRLENQKIVFKATRYNLCRQLSECVLYFEELLEQKQLVVEAEMEDRAMVEADESFLEIVWNNLLSNAVKFTEQGGTIRLHQWSEAGKIVVTVSDSGCGMDKQTQERIFEKFYQGDNSHSTEGNGLGLALVSRVLELLHGSVNVESEPGKGSIFRVEIPIL